MAVTRIKNNQITDATVVANAKLVDYSISSAKLANNLTYNSDLTITGNLTVQGNATAIDTTITTIEDPVIVLASTQTSGAPAVDIGFLGFRGNQSNIAFVWDESATEFVTAFTSTGETNTTITITSYANFHTNDANVSGNLTIGGNIDITGNVSSLNVTGNISGGNLLTPGVVSATSNITGGNLLTGGLISATGNITGGNVLYGSGIVTGTGNIYGGNIIATDAFFGNIDLTGDITVNSLTSNTFVSATGNINTANAFNGATLSLSGNVTSNLNVSQDISGSNISTPGLITAAGNITGGNLFTGGDVSASGNLIGNNVNTDNVYSSAGLTMTAANGSITLNPSGNIDASSSYINNVADPVQAQDAATKQYVDDAVSSGIHIHTPVYVESPTALNATYAQGGNTFTVNQTIAGNTVVFSTAANLQPNDQLWFSNSFEGIVANTAYFVVSAPNTSSAVLSLSYSGAPVTTITSNTGLTQSVRVNSGVGATLTNAGANATLQIDGVTLSNGQRALIYTQANAVHNGVYVVTEAGNASVAWVLTRSSDTDTYIPDDTLGLDEGSYFYVQAGDTGAGESYVMTAPNGPFIIGYNNLTFTQFSASQVYTANTNAGLSLTGTVFSAKVDNNTTAFDGGGNIIVKAGANLTTPNIGAATGTSLSLTGNVTSGNVLTGGAVSATGDITGGNLATAGTVSATGNVTGGNVLTGGVISATGNITTAGALNGATLSLSGNVTSALNVTGNIAGGNITTPGLISATGNITGGNIDTAGQVTATGNVTGGNIQTAGLITATGNIYGDNLILSGAALDTTAGRLTVNSTSSDADFAVNGDTVANVFYVDAGTGTASFGSSTQTTNAIVAFNSTTSVLMPVGNTAQRPGTGVTGMLRFNTTDNNLEIYNNSAWEAVGVPAFTVIADEQFNGDGSTVAFTLATSQTTNSCIVSINGVVQIPTIAYSVTGTTLTFTEAPLTGDLIDVRQITTTTSVTSLSNSSGNAEISASETSATFNVKGNLIPTANVTYSLGNSTNRWANLFLSGSTIVLGNTVLKNTSGNSIGFFGPDGTTPATIDAASVDTTTIANGTSNVRVTASNGNVAINVNGNGIVTFAAGGILNNMGNGVGNIGNSSGYFNTIFAKATSAQYADLAEKYTADANYEPGTVVMFGGSEEVTVCTNDACRRVAGVISTNPSYIMNGALEAAHVATVALTGRVPCRVTGSVRKGDLMVSAGNGRARAEADPKVGTVIGKALADFDGTEGVIEVVVGRF